MTEPDRIAARRKLDQAKRARIGKAGKAREGQALVQAIVAERPKRVYGRCIYCSAPCLNRACKNHWDVYQLELQTARLSVAEEAAA